MKKIFKDIFSKKLLKYIILTTTTFLLGFSIQKIDYIKFKNIILKIYYKDITGPKKVICPKDPFVIAYFGQSNSAGYVKPLSKSEFPKNLLQFDWRTGNCYQYKEPLYGSEGKFGNSITDYALLLAKTIEYPIVIVPFGKAGSSINLWAYGYLYRKFEIVLEQLKLAKLNPHIFLWHQGENDSRSFDADESNFYKVPYFRGPSGSKFMLGMSTIDYEKALSKIINKSKKEFPDSYFGVALASRCGRNKPWESIRIAQRNSSKLFKKVFISADSDSIYGTKYRYDECHFSRLGSIKLGEMYFESTSKLFNFKTFKKVDN
tara:strand:- start:6666 stop:7619 length:954 start_codon:yes stop_codon:yes gene_type:complete